MLGAFVQKMRTIAEFVAFTFVVLVFLAMVLGLTLCKGFALLAKYVTYRVNSVR